MKAKDPGIRMSQLGSLELLPPHIRCWVFDRSQSLCLGCGGWSAVGGSVDLGDVDLESNLEPDIDIDASASSGHGSILGFMTSTFHSTLRVLPDFRV